MKTLPNPLKYMNGIEIIRILEKYTMFQQRYAVFGELQRPLCPIDL